MAITRMLGARRGDTPLVPSPSFIYMYQVPQLAVLNNSSRRTDLVRTRSC